MKAIADHMKSVVQELASCGHLHAGDLFLIGCSTSEVAGERIGSAGNMEIANLLFQQLEWLGKETNINLVFQCCEHLNRAIVVEKQISRQYGLTEVSAIPVAKAGGSMAAYAYEQFQDPVLVEDIQAHAGIDIGETMIGMHLKSVAVPFRLQQRFIGGARVNTAYTRPKLIGGVRAVYPD
ncbi:TIGR01440 family protein [Terribacillus aidingensis]|uniref:UPF0340 protein SAMN05421503_0660 n=1 Tax=Terribacillus aidingensis TaxID=586416 RepID=A0A285N4S2_9BACI|nr:TIGR01440 family protein [Terribacillus aidingensis]